MTDIEISRNSHKLPIYEVGKKIGLKKKDLELYGDYKAKIKTIKDRKKQGKLILVTAISPTPMGEGKTTVSIGLGDAFHQLGEKVVLALREPSMGPVFGMKGGATGGGYSQVVPMEDINLHFTGDFHAMTSANNLISAAIDNHIYFGNSLGIDKVVWKRCVDLNDRQLRMVNTGLSGEKKIVPRMDSFDISVASEVMAILCLSKDMADLKWRLGNITVGYTKEGKPIYARDLKADGSMAVLLKDAIKPNLVQTLEHTPAIIHGGPFANIAHGCNSIIATKMALKLGDYVITEAGFGADLGAEKFLDIKCREMGVFPSLVVVVATVKALKYHGGASKNDVFLEDFSALEKGIDNLYKHVLNIKNKFGLNVIVGLNRYDTDTDEEIALIREKLKLIDVSFSEITGYSSGGKGAIDISKKLVELTKQDKQINYMYDLSDSIQTKIEKVCKKIYYARGVIYSPSALEEIEKIKKLGYDNYPICIAKTQYSLSDDPKNLLCDNDYDIYVRNIEIRTGAGFIVVLAGDIMTMPGLPKEPAACEIDIDESSNIVGIF